MADKAIIVIGVGGLLYYLYENYTAEQPSAQPEDDPNKPSGYFTTNDPPGFDPTIFLDVGMYIVADMVLDFLGRQIGRVLERQALAKAEAAAVRRVVQAAGDKAARNAAAKGLSIAEQQAARKIGEEAAAKRLTAAALRREAGNVGARTAGKFGEGILRRAQNGVLNAGQIAAASKARAEAAAIASREASDAAARAVGTTAERAAQEEAAKALQASKTAAAKSEAAASRLAAQEANELAARELIAKKGAQEAEELLARKTAQEAEQLTGKAGAQLVKLTEEEITKKAGQNLTRAAGEKAATAGAGGVRGMLSAAGSVLFGKSISAEARAAAASANAARASTRLAESKSVMITSKMSIKESSKILAEAARAAYNNVLAQRSLYAAERGLVYAAQYARMAAQGGVLRTVGATALRMGRAFIGMISRGFGEVAARTAGAFAIREVIAKGAAVTAGKIVAMSVKAAASLTNPFTAIMVVTTILAITLVLTLDITEEAFEDCAHVGDFAPSSLPFAVKFIIELIPIIGDFFSVLSPAICLGVRCDDDEEVDVMIPGFPFFPAPWCFKRPPESFKCHSFLCYADYPEFENNGMLHTFAHATKHILMDTGTIPSWPPMINGKPGIRSGALYYEDINTETDKWDIVAGVAWHRCPEGYTDRGVFCDNYYYRETAVLRECPKGWVDDGLICREPITSSFKLLPCAPGDRDDGLLCWGDEDYDKDTGSLNPDDFIKRISRMFKDKFGQDPNEWYKKKELWFNGDAPIGLRSDDTYAADKIYKAGDVVTFNGEPFRLMKEFGGAGFSPQYWSCLRNTICKIASEAGNLEQRDNYILSYTGWTTRLAEDIATYPTPYSSKNLIGYDERGVMEKASKDLPNDPPFNPSKFAPGGWWQEVFPEVRRQERERVAAWNAKLLDWEKNVNTWKEKTVYEIGDMVQRQDFVYNPDLEESVRSGGPTPAPITIDDMMNGKPGSLPNFICYKLPKRYRKEPKSIDIGGMKSRTNDMFDYFPDENGDIFLPPEIDSEHWTSPYSEFGISARNADNTWVGQETYDAEFDKMKAEKEKEIQSIRSGITMMESELSGIYGELRDKDFKINSQKAMLEVFKVTSSSMPEAVGEMSRNVDIEISKLTTDIALLNSKVANSREKIDKTYKEVDTKQKELANTPKTRSTVIYSKGDMVVYTDRQIYVSLYSNNYNVRPTDENKIWLRLPDKLGDPTSHYEIKNEFHSEDLKYKKVKLVSSTYELAVEKKKDFTVIQDQVFDPMKVYREGDSIIFRGDKWKARRDPPYVRHSLYTHLIAMTIKPDINQLMGEDNVKNYLQAAWFPQADTFNCRMVYPKDKVVIYALEEYKLTQSLPAARRKEFVKLARRDLSKTFCGMSPVLIPTFWKKLGWKGKEPYPKNLTEGLTS